MQRECNGCWTPSTHRWIPVNTPVVGWYLVPRIQNSKIHTGGDACDTRLALRMNVLQMPHQFEASHLSCLAMGDSNHMELKTYLHRLVMPISWNPGSEDPDRSPSSSEVPPPSGSESEVLAADGYSLRLGWRQHSIDPSRYGVPVADHASAGVLWTTG